MDLLKLLDTPRICTALAEWGACLTYICILKKRMSRPRFILSILGALILFIAYHLFAGTLPLHLWIPGMIGAVVLIYVFLRLLTNTSWQDVFFCCIRAFVLAEFTASLHWLFYAWSCVRRGREDNTFAAVTLLFFYGAIFCIYFFLERKHIPRTEKLGVSVKELAGAAIIALVAFFISNISFIMPNTPFSTVNSSILYVRALVDFGGLVMLFAQQDKREELRLRSENQAMNTMLQHQYDQYRLSIDNIELLRREFHDLKHYMLIIRSEQDPEKREQYLSEMEDAIITQEALSNTGNSVLDVVLTTKSTYCAQSHIHFTCMADGELISFMHVKDICSIFGNALDNAIECVTHFADYEKRLITLSMYRKNQFLIIQCENYTETPLVLEKNRLPDTTKSDPQSHGYGLKSIRHAVEKYGGSMTLQSEDNWFTLKILIPLEQPLN